MKTMEKCPGARSALRLCLGLLLLLQGCASHAAGVDDAGRFSAKPSLGVIGVLSPASEPVLGLDGPPTPGKALGIGATNAVAKSWMYGVALGPGGLVAALFLTPLTAIGGAIYGAVNTAAAADTAARVAAIEHGLARVAPAEAVPLAVIAAARSDRPPLVLLEPDGAPPVDVATRLEISRVRVVLEQETMCCAPRRGIPETTLAVAERRRLKGFVSTEANPTLRLVVTAHVRLLRTDDTALIERDLEELGAAQTFNSWADEDGQPLTDALIETCRALGARIVDEVP